MALLRAVVRGHEIAKASDWDEQQALFDALDVASECVTLDANDQEPR